MIVVEPEGTHSWFLQALLEEQAGTEERSWSESVLRTIQHSRSDGEGAGGGRRGSEDLGGNAGGQPKEYEVGIEGGH